MSIRFGRNFLRASVAFAVAASLAGLGSSTTGCGEDAPDEAGKNDAGQSASAREAGAGQDKDAASSVENRDAGGSNAPSDAGGGAVKDAGAPLDGDGPSVEAGSTSLDGGGASTARFSFFLTSQAGLAKLAGKAEGFGGDLRFGKADGLSGADEICRRLAENSMPGNGKTWRAFLSVTKGPDGKPINALDRIGEGPWYDRRERVFAMNKQALMSTRPMGCDPVIANDFPNEDGVPNHDPGTGIIDNHNTLTGTGTNGAVDSRGLTATCQDWTSNQADAGKPRCGVSWPRGQLTHWISTLDEGGCAPGATPPGAEGGARGTVGALGGYGGFYCFALTP